MTAPAKESTALARVDDESREPKGMERYREFGALPVHARAEVYRAREVREVADMVLLTEWGKSLSAVGAAAIAKWCIRRDVDPMTELDNVGGPYINSEYYLRKLGELRVRGIVRDHEQINVAADARLEVLAKDQNAPEEDRNWAKAEHYKRLRLRATYNVPEAATGACLTLIYLTAGGEAIPGVKWGGGGTSVKQPRSGGASAPNPVVEANAALSVESQSIRRAMRLLASKHPSVLPEFIEGDSETPEIRAAVEETRRIERGEILVPGWDANRGTPVQQLDGYDEIKPTPTDEHSKPIPTETIVESDGELALGDTTKKPTRRNALAEGQ